MATFLTKTINISKYFNRPRKHLSAKDRIYFLQVLAEMLDQGFSMNQSLQFMKILLPKEVDRIQALLDQLLLGQGFEHLALSLGYSRRIAAQIFFAQKQGRFQAALFEIVNHLKLIAHHQKKLGKTLAYPAILIVFLTALLFGMRQFMLPHILSFVSPEILEQQTFAKILILLITFMPQITLAGLSLAVFSYLAADYYLMKIPLLRRYQLLTKLPLFGGLIRKYASYRLAQELGYFYAGGFSMQQTLDFLVKYPIDPFLSELAKELRQAYLDGKDLAQSLNQLNLFTTSLALVIYQGELTSQTGHKCRLYAQKLFQEVLDQVNRYLNLIQPLLFVLIALIVMAMYLVLMLPMLTMEI